MVIIVEDIMFKSNDLNLKGRTYRPSEQGRHPAVAICHGYPGNTKNMDLAEELAFNGIVALVFFYQGAWGSEGTFRFSNLAPSTVDAVRYLKSLSYVDPERVGLVSHSMGAIPLTNVMSRDKTIKTGVLISPASDISKWLEKEVLDNIFPIFIGIAEGRLAYGDGEDYKKDMGKVAFDLNPMDKVASIEAPIMIIVASADNVAPPEDSKALYEKATVPKKFVLIDGADHDFNDHRVVLQEKILEWLRENL